MKRWCTALRGTMRKKTFHNLMYVGGVQAVNVLIPLITGPWVLRALQPEGYGRFALALALVQYGILLVDFGFNLTATQNVAKIRDDQDRVSKYFWTVQTARLTLAIIATAAILATVLIVPKFRPVIPVAIAYLPILLGTLLYPQWLFLGLERMKVISIASISGRVVSAIPIFIFVHTPADAPIAAFLSASNYLVAGFIAVTIIVNGKLINGFAAPRLKETVEVCRDAWPLFVSSIAVSLYSTSNAIILGLVRNSYEVGLFGAADRIRTYALIPINPIATVFFPRISRTLTTDRTRALVSMSLVTLTLGVTTLCISITLYFGAPLIVRAFAGASFSDASDVLAILSPVPFLVGLNTAFGTLAMVNLGMKKASSTIIVFCGMLNIVILVVLASQYGAKGAAISLTTTETLVTIFMAITLSRTGVVSEAVSACRQRFRKTG